MRHLLPLTAILVACSLVHISGAVNPAPSPPVFSGVRADVDLQARLKTELSILNLKPDGSGAKPVLALLERDHSKGHLLQQLIIFEQNAEGEKLAWAGLYLIKGLTTEMDPSEVLKSLAPLLTTNDITLNKRAGSYVLGVCTVQSSTIDFSSLAELADDGRNEKYWPLVKFAVDVSPGDTLSSFARVAPDMPIEERKAIPVAEHIISCFEWIRRNEYEVPASMTQAVKAEVLQLAGGKLWWKRMVAAAMIRRYPELGTPEIIKKLQQDTHSFVQEIMSKTNNPAKKGKGDMIQFTSP